MLNNFVLLHSFVVYFLLAFSNLYAAAPTGYYDSVDSSSSTNLRSTLHEVIDDHTYFPYTSSSTDTWDILNLADEDEDNTNNITAIYKNASYGKISGGNGAYNREHTWPNSYGFPDRGPSNYAYSDTHQLFLSDVSYNSDRGNKYYDDCTSGCTTRNTVFNDGQGGSSGEVNLFDSNSWEVWSERKGDIARAMFYMDIRYEGGNHNVTNVSEPDLILTNNSALIQTSGGNNASTAYMGLLDVLIEWHQEDPVEQGEVDRNDIIQSFQGNRNPFVDNPEWVECLYLDQCDEPEVFSIPITLWVPLFLGFSLVLLYRKIS